MGGLHRQFCRCGTMVAPSAARPPPHLCKKVCDAQRDAAPAIAVARVPKQTNPCVHSAAHGAVGVHRHRWRAGGGGIIHLFGRWCGGGGQQMVAAMAETAASFVEDRNTVISADRCKTDDFCRLCKFCRLLLDERSPNVAQFVESGEANHA